MKRLIIVAANDFRLVFRDNSLKLFLAMPLLILVVMRYGVPYVAGFYEGIRDYVGIILMLATTQGAVAFGFVYSMVLVDEKDTSVAKVYGVLPVSKFWFVAFRLFPPFVLATAATFFLLLVQPFYVFTAFPVLFYSMLAGLIAPLMVLFVAMLADNKIEAMTWQKLFNAPLFVPILAFFVPAPFAILFAILPTWWAFQGLRLMIEGKDPWGYLLVGSGYSVLSIVIMIGQFTSRHFR
jgi:fluoroquinolone transport system permease protein